MSMRKILIPVAAGLLFSPALMAADITDSAANGSVANSYSNEHLQSAIPASVVAGNDLNVTLGAEYAVGDIITIALSGGALDAGLLSTITVGVITDIAAGGPGNSGITLGLLSDDENGGVYRVTAIDSTGVAAPTTVGTIIPLATGAALTFDAALVDAANTIVATYSATTDTGFALDSGGTLNTFDYITTGAQYDVEVTTAFNGIIDVENNRETFASPVGTADALVITIANDTSFTAESAFVDYDIVVVGDYSWIFDTDPATEGIQFRTGGAADVVTQGGGGTCTALVVTTTDISFSCDTVGAVTLTLDVVDNDDDGTPPAAAILPAGAFSATVDVNFVGIAATDTDQPLSGSAGAWTLNGYQAFIPYMPYESGISQVIYLANRGVQTGDITVDWIGLNGTSGTLGVIASLGAGTTLSIGPIINAALPAAQRASSRLALTITANVPAGDVQMNSQYNVNGNRAFTLHEDNRP